MLSVQPDRRAALVVAHPGHELRVFGWLTAARPQVFVLTDGSGRSGNSRLPRTTRILEDANATRGNIYGELTDAEIYAAILSGNLDLFVTLAEKLSIAFQASRVEYVAADAIEGYNPAHDICRILTDAAVAIARRHAGHKEIEQFDVLMAGKLSECPSEALSGAHWIKLDDRTFARKLEAARSYPEIERDVDQVVAAEGLLSLNVECLRRARQADLHNDLFVGRPYYEQHGEQRAAAGHYAKVIRYREHFLPLARKLMDYAMSRGQLAHAYPNY